MENSKEITIEQTIHQTTKMTYPNYAEAVENRLKALMGTQIIDAIQNTKIQEAVVKLTRTEEEVPGGIIKKTIIAEVTDALAWEGMRRNDQSMILELQLEIDELRGERDGKHD